MSLIINPRTFVNADMPHMARLHDAAFARGWSESEFRDLLHAPGTHALVAGGENLSGFVLYRVMGDECEILTIVVDAEHRRQYVGKWLVGKLLESVSTQGVKTVFLEVAEDNDTAQAFYRSLGFGVSGRRKGYYAQGRESATDALLMQLRLRA